MISLNIIFSNKQKTMNVKNFQVDAKPTEKDLNEIEVWLNEEEKKYDEGFYRNWYIISQAFLNNKLIVLKSNTENIGFCTISDCEIYVKIDILEIRRELRNKGVGKFFFNELENKFKRQGFKVIILDCSPITSKEFWQKMGFKQLLGTGSSTLYKVLIEISKPTLSLTSNRLDLWDKEPNEVLNQKPTWSWKIPKKGTKFDCPILHPCSPDWQLRLVRNGNIIKEEKVKYFSKQIFNRQFLFIENNDFKPSI